MECNAPVVVARYLANGETITKENLHTIIFSNYIIDRIMFAVNKRLGLLN